MHDLRETRLLDFLHGLYAPRGGLDLVEFLLTRVPEIIGCHNRGIARYDPARRSILQMNLHAPFTSRAFIDSVRAGGDMAPESFWQMQPEARHPVHIISQMFSRNQWDNHPMYREMFRSEGLVDCMTLEFGDSARRFMFCLHRDRRGFSEGEIQTLRLLAPHLEQAFANARLFESAIPGLAGTTGQPQVHPLGSGSDHTVREMIRRHRARWHTRLGHDPGRSLEDLHDWILSGLDHLDRGILESALAPFELRGSCLSVRFRLMRHWGGDGHLLAEETTSHWHFTPREKEVLHWVRLGKSDREIGAILDVSHHTVKEHLRRVYRKTGTRNRTAAARLVPHPGDTGFPT